MKNKFTKLCILLGLILAFLCFAWFKPSEPNLISIIMSFTSHRVDIAELGSLNSKTKIKFKLPKDGRGWPLYAEHVSPDDYTLDGQIEFKFKSPTEKPIRCFVRDNKNNVKEHSVSQNEYVIIYKGSIGEFLFELNRDNKLRDNSDGKTFTEWNPIVFWRNQDFKITGELEFILGNDVLLKSPIKLYSYLPQDTL